jgi:hypothetical protein
MKTDRGPIEIQFTANFLQIPEEFFWNWMKSRQNGPLEALTCMARPASRVQSAAGRRS